MIPCPCLYILLNNAHLLLHPRAHIIKRKAWLIFNLVFKHRLIDALLSIKRNMLCCKNQPVKALFLSTFIIISQSCTQLCNILWTINHKKRFITLLYVSLVLKERKQILEMSLPFFFITVLLLD